MRLLVAIVMFVVVPLVCMADSTQNVPPSPQENSKPPDSQPQGSHEDSGDTTPALKNPTNNTVSANPSTKDTKEDPAPTREEGSGKDLWITRSALIVSLFSFLVALIGLIQTSKTRRIIERAYVTVEQWEPEGDYIMCRVANRGRTPATLLSGYTEYRLQGVASSLPFPRRRRLKRDFQGAELPAQGAFPMQVGSPGHDVWKRIKELRDITLYVIAHLQFRDVFGEIRPTHFVMEYDARIDKFVIADIRTSEKE